MRIAREVILQGDLPGCDKKPHVDFLGFLWLLPGNCFSPLSTQKGNYRKPVARGDRLEAQCDGFLYDSSDRI